MKILNVREGFACNSSSTHSILFSKEKLTDYDVSNYGWNHFIAASVEAKTAWFATQLFVNLQNLDLDKFSSLAIIKDIVGDNYNTNFLDTEVDHQSAITFPRAWTSPHSIDIEFAKDFYKWLLIENLVILGGNDNDEENFNIRLSGTRIFYRNFLDVDEGDQLHTVARKDTAGYWTIFNKQNGNKLRLAFEENNLQVDVTRASTPELVDLKITDFCTFNCKTCYQGSTISGKHGNINDIRQVLAHLGELKVFEVAIGGGEPTLHPQFEEIIEYANYNNVTPNITTRDPKWFSRFPHLIDKIGGVAISCDDATMMYKVIDCIDQLPAPQRDIVRRKTYIQHILGITSEYNVAQMFSICAREILRITLLGYKVDHRGKTFKPNVPEKGITWGKWLHNYIKKGKDLPYSIGIDTVLVNEVTKFVESYRITPFEGQFSCYVNAVNGLSVSASSFGDHIPLKLDKENSFEVVWNKLKNYQPTSAYDYNRKNLVVIP